ncbi:DUF4097 family beta strand repeat-containing protein [Conexibacter arvalis]|uniref:DUF4097 and DUF4098 domain-containing protein YvlB n=1 Tax=Conexibacter arvalis TaxID=912552 RepID=A0A840IIS8_9ACTN|nr:DUF4097 and DUF4098 domain-containing protein YvlB [Conexibacter arvalis]
MSTTPSRRGIPTPVIVVCVALGVLVAAWGALFFAAWSVHQDERTARTYADVEQLRINGGSGDIAVVAEDRDDVEVITHLSWALKKPRVEHSFRDGSLQLTGGCGFWGSFGPDGCDAEFEVRVPRDLEVEVHGASGDVSGRGLAGRSVLTTGSGDVTAVDLAGPLRIKASSGDVTVEGYRGRAVDAQASSGDVTVRTQVVPDRVRAVASSGDVTVVVPGTLAYAVAANTSSGDVSVAVDQSLRSRHEIEARTSSGNVDVARLDDAR